MILLILFGLVFLVGVSLFAALVGTSILKKNARVVRATGEPGPGRALPERGGRYAAFVRPESAPPEAPPEPDERPSTQRRQEPADYDRRYRREYQDELGEMREEVEARTGHEAASRPADQAGAGPYQAAPGTHAGPAPGTQFPPFPASGKTRAGAGFWVLAVLAALVLFSGALYITLRGWPSALTEPRLYFCEYVDFARQKPVNRSDTFTRGNVTLFVKSPKQLGMNSARIEVYRLGEQQEPYAEKTIPLRPSWMSFAVQVLFEHTGNYRVSVLREDGTPIGIGRLSIVPDSHAYKPIPVETSPEPSPERGGTE